MKLFLTRLGLFLLIFCVLGEVSIRTFRLVSDIPQRSIDEYGIQRFKLGQSGYNIQAKAMWNVNNYGWVGTYENKKDSTISIIGDSFIANMMNPIECHQGSILKEYLPEYAFFEAGRPGVSFIEAMEISRILEIELNPKYQLLYLKERDFYQSISEIRRHKDIHQISIEKQKILTAQIKFPRLKKILYSVKVLYYAFKKYPNLLKIKNKGEVKQKASLSNTYHNNLLSALFEYCSKHYRLDKLIFVLHPNTDDKIVALADKYGIKTLLLDSRGDKTWKLGNHDRHWSCYGHNQVSKQVKNLLIKTIR